MAVPLLMAVLLALVAPVPAGAQESVPLRAFVDSIAAAEIAAGRVAGFTVAVVRDGETLLHEEYGFADLGTGESTPAGAIYEAASIAKQLTAAAILQLQDDGLLDLDDPLGEYLPEFPAPPSLTLRHLLHHTAGLPDYASMPQFMLTTTSAPTREEILSMVVGAEPLQEPGVAMVYSNAGYLLLARVVEAVSGTDYPGFLEARLFGPAGMTDSSYCDPEELPRLRIRGHRMADDGLTPSPFINHGWSMGAASLCTTAADLVAWNEALHGGRILSADGYREMVAPGRLNAGIATRYAAGLMVDSIYGRAARRHGGSLPGFRSYLAYFPEDGLSVVVLANSSGPFSPTEVGQEIARVALGSTPPAAPRFYDFMARVTGLYRGEGRNGERVMRISADSSGAASIDGPAEYAGPLLDLGGGMAGGAQMRIRFIEEDGAVIGAWLDEVGEVIRLVRQPLGD